MSLTGINRPCRDVLMQVPKLAKKISQVRERLDTSLVASLDTPAEKVLQFLGQEEDKLEEHRERATKLSEYQVTHNPCSCCDTIVCLMWTEYLMLAFTPGLAKGILLQRLSSAGEGASLLSSDFKKKYFLLTPSSNTSVI